LSGPYPLLVAASRSHRDDGAVALLPHPGVAALRVQPKPRRAPEPMLALPPHNELEDLGNLLRGL